MDKTIYLKEDGGVSLIVAWIAVTKVVLHDIINAPSLEKKGREILN